MYLYDTIQYHITMYLQNIKHDMIQYLKNRNQMIYIYQAKLSKVGQC